MGPRSPRTIGHKSGRCSSLPGLTGELDLSQYRWETEIDLPDARLESISDDRIYLLGISGGGSLALAYVAARPGRIAGLGLIEPAWSFLPLSRIEQDYFARLEAVLRLPPEQQRDAFVRLLVQPGTDLPPITPTAQRGYRSARRPEDTGLAIVTRAMQQHRVEPSELAAFRGPVYLAIGGRSNPMWRALADQLKNVMPQTLIETYPDRHHLDLPHHAEAGRLSRALIDVWGLS